VLSDNSTGYTNFTSAYWSAQQAAVKPHCVFKPSETSQVSTLVLLSRLAQCPFAVKGGGHAAFAGASSIMGGITVALQNLNEVKLSSHKKIAAIGPGNRWIDVYKILEEYGVQVIGGRVSVSLRSIPHCMGPQTLPAWIQV
jgi:FAD/FMN-containing dehydrogenase